MYTYYEMMNIQRLKKKQSSGLSKMLHTTTRTLVFERGLEHFQVSRRRKSHPWE